MVASESAVLVGQFNVAKILRAAAYTQRTLAMNAARLLEESQVPEVHLATITNEVQKRIDSGQISEDKSNLPQQLAQFNTVCQRLDTITQRALDSLEKNTDVLEKDVHLFLNGCYNCGNLVEGDLPDVCDICGALGIEFERFGPFYAATPEHLGQLTPEMIISIMADIPDQVSSLIIDADEAWLADKPTEDEWSVKEIVAHMLETDKLFVQRVRSILNQTKYDQSLPPWKLHEGKGYDTLSVNTLITHLQQARDESLKLVRGLSPRDWARSGIMLGGSRSIVDLGTWLANHDRGHLAQIKQRLS